MNPSFADLQSRLPGLLPRDQRRLRRRIDGARKVRDPAAREAIAAQIAADLDAADSSVSTRKAAVPAISYPAELPVSRAKDEILAAIRDNQVVIVAGETGSGKTTQLPKICLELGRGVLSTIGHTQPRRLAARTVAERIAEELGTQLGGVVGYKVRFTDQVGADTLVKLMTDGILLAEIQHDRLLSQYDTLIIDEAHERSLNIDFILGYLRQLLPRRPDLKVIITSATIDPDRFARHFSDAPVIEVSGRTYPVELRYRPLIDDEAAEEDTDLDEDRPATADRDQNQAICDAVDELAAEGPGDILVFLSGEREIRDTADALEKMDLRGTEVVPLYARLSVAEQHRVFQPHPGRRIVLATNVAETSLTVPGIKYVIDPGYARISRYGFRTKVQRLPIEPISQASANQRKGRCGRVSDGICIRLYSEQDFLARPEFTDPEILRTNLASVILQMTAIGLGDIAAFPFIDPPDRRNITDGVVLLQELGAFEPAASAGGENRLTGLGRKLAQLPVDPRLGRMVLEADRNGCLREVVVITAALSIQDPRERPTEHRQAADEKHARFADKDSDFLGYLNLWNHLREQQRELSTNRFRRLCRNEFLSYLRVREWQDIYSQLKQVIGQLGMTLNSEAGTPENIHISLLSGLLSHLGLKDGQKQEYIGARNARFAIFPGSALFKKQPRWAMAAELVETSRLWGRIVARIEPEWAETLAPHLVKREYSEPHWELNKAAVIASEKITLYGLPIIASRPVNYGRIDQELARDLFIRHALLAGEWRTHHKFLAANRALLDEVGELENRARRRDILVDDQALFDFYDQRIGQDVVSGRHFDSWWKKTRSTQPQLLTFTKEMLVNANASAAADQQAFPDDWQQEGLKLPLTYEFEPGAQTDGVTVRIPLPVLNQVRSGFDWHIPGLRAELVTALIKSLPKQLRRNFVPVPDFAAAALDRMADYDSAQEPLLDALERELFALGGVRIPRDAWQPDKLPEHLKITFQVVDEQDKVIAEGKNLDALRQQLKPTLRATLSAAGENIEKRGLRGWDFGTLPDSYQQERFGYLVTGYPALVDDGESVSIRLFEDPAEAETSMWRGVRRLLLLNVSSPVKYITRQLDNATKLVLSRNPHRGVADLLEDCITCAVDKLVADAGGAPREEAGFTALLELTRRQLPAAVLTVVVDVAKILTVVQEVDLGVAEARFAPKTALADITAQRNGLVYRGFVTDTGAARLPDVLRYLRAIQQRLEKLATNPARDEAWRQQVEEVRAAYAELLDAVPAGKSPSRDLLAVRWMIEELRVSYFAQTLGTAYPVSDKRIYRALDALERPVVSLAR
ncbi:MAG TPA: ATP-dependent RNA helicase HrpA [Pseudonocardiaceae bacterium]|nr:ATP-dependent RNA helicase HrpA [Pseudonocardiaceae bacterium]